MTITRAAARSMNPVLAPLNIRPVLSASPLFQQAEPTPAVRGIEEDARSLVLRRGRERRPHSYSWPATGLRARVKPLVVVEGSNRACAHSPAPRPTGPATRQRPRSAISPG